MRYRVLRPPYCYRWGVLVLSIVTVAVFGLSALNSGEQKGGTAAAALPAGNTAPAAKSTRTESNTLIRHTRQNGKVVALTFDDGPDPRYTWRVLDLLGRYDAVATFCMVGTQVNRYPELVRAVASRGMRLCDHTVTHDDRLPERGERRITAEVLGGWTDLLLAAGGDAGVDYFRAPGGNWSERLIDVAARQGMRPLSWSVDSRDWTLPGTEQIVRTVRQGVEPGAVILLHDGGGRREQTVAALAKLLPWLRDRGYRFGFPD